MPRSLSTALSTGSLWAENRRRFTVNLLEAVKNEQNLTTEKRFWKSQGRKSKEGVFMAGRSESLGNAGVDFVQDPSFL